MMAAVQTSETLVNSYQSTRRYNPEDGHLQKIPQLTRLTTNYEKIYETKWIQNSVKGI
jgi:hypothetical protein